MWKPKSKRQRFKKRPPQNPRLVLFKQCLIGLILSVFLVAVGYAVWHGTRIETLTISEVSVTGGDTVSGGKVKEMVEAELAGDYFKLVPRRFAWTYPETAIKKTLLTVDRIKSVDLVVESGQVLNVHFNEYHPAALWCALDSNDCIFLESSGYAFAKAPALNGTSLIRFSGSTAEFAVGNQAFAEEFVSHALTLVSYLEDNLNLKAKEVMATAPNEFDLHLQAGGYLKVNANQPLTETIENLETVLNSQEFGHLTPGNFLYVDLRYGNKLFIKESEPENETATTSVADYDLFNL